MNSKVAEKLRVLPGLERSLAAILEYHKKHASEVSPILLPRARQERDQRVLDLMAIAAQLKQQRLLVERNAALEAEVAALKVGQAALKEQASNDKFQLTDAQAALRILRTVLRAGNLKAGADESSLQYQRMSARWMRSGIVQLVKEKLGPNAALILKRNYPIHADLGLPEDSDEV